MPIKTPPLPDDCGTLEALSKRLHISKSTLWSYSKLETAPKGLNILEWRKFLDENDLAKPKQKTVRSLQKLNEEKVALQNEKLRLEIAKIRGQTLSREEVNEMLLSVASHQRAILYQVMENELPVSCDGIPIAESRVLHRNAADKICDEMLKLSARITIDIEPKPELESDLAPENQEEAQDQDGDGSAQT